MITQKKIMRLIVSLAVPVLFSSCFLNIDGISETAYKSSLSKRNYFIITGVTHSHCGCSDMIVRNYKNRKIDFKFYYGGGLYQPKKYVYKYTPGKAKADIQVYVPVETDNYTIPLDSTDKEILQQINILIKTRPKGSGLNYPVKQHEYKGFVRQHSYQNEL
jgi:hypothetical protein